MENKIINYLIELLPQNIYYVDPYLDNVPLPKEDFCQFNILSSKIVGRSTARQKEIIKDTQEIKIIYDVNKIYTVQVDFYGKNSFDNTEMFQQLLQINLDKNSSSSYNNSSEADDINKIQIGLKTIGDISNLTDLLTDKLFYKRYKFTLELFTVQSIETNNSKDILIDNFKLTKKCY